MNLIIDAGNSTVKLAIFNGRRIESYSRHEGWHPEAIGRLIQEFAIRNAILSSVRDVPDEVYTLLVKPGCRLLELTTGIPLPLRIDYKTPATLGKDRIAAAVGAWALYPHRNLMVVDAGTALTMDLVNDQGIFEGGVISPGLMMRFKALNQFTGRLPLVDPNDDPPLIGKSTTEAIQSGVLMGMIYEVDNYINSLKNKYNGLAVILTGGDAPRLTGKLKNTIFVEPNLVLNGLNCILSHNELVTGSGIMKHEEI